VKLTILGGAAACPNPGQGSSSYLLELGDSTFLLDCGPDTLQELRKHAELDQINTILISHLHADHTLDLVPLRYGLKYAPGLQPSRPKLLMPPDGTSFLHRVANAFAMGSEGSDGFFEEIFDVDEFDSEDLLEQNAARITFLQTNHPVPCWAMRFEYGEHTLVYLADTGPLESLVPFAQGADILICEGTFPVHSDVARIEDRPHLSAFEAGQIARDAGARHFILTHLWSTAGFDRYVSEATEGFGGDVSVAKPGFSIALD
jgi:ribonuclease BN (tRNA processing enzyme)